MKRLSPEPGADDEADVIVARNTWCSVPCPRAAEISFDASVRAWYY